MATKPKRRERPAGRWGALLIELIPLGAVAVIIVIAYYNGDDAHVVLDADGIAARVRRR